MRKILPYLLAALISIGCSARYAHESLTFGASHSGLYRIHLPQGYERFLITSGDLAQYEFRYPDSSIIYVVETDFISKDNYRKISRSGGGNYFQRNFSADSMTIEGRDGNLVWKDVRLGSVSLGYVNVPFSKKEIYDKALESLQKTGGPE